MLTANWKSGGVRGTRKCSDEEILAAYEKYGGQSMARVLTELGYNWGSARTVERVLHKYNIVYKPR